MRQTKSKNEYITLIILALAALAAMLLINGCMESETFYEDVRASRTSSYSRLIQREKQEQNEKTQVEGALGIQDAIKLAMLNNTELLAVVQQREIARGKVVESYSAVLPSVTAEAGYNRKDEIGGFTINGQPVKMGELDNYSADLRVRQPLYRGGAIGAALRAAKLYELYSDEQVRAQLQATLYTTALAYYDMLLAQQLYKVNEDAVKSAQTALNDIKAKRSQGMASEFDILRAEVDVSNFRAEMIQQKNRISVARSRLTKAMGVMESGTLELTDSLEYVKTSLLLEEALKIAYENRADLYLAEYELRLQKESVTVAQSEYMPQLNAVFTQGWSRPDPHDMMLDEWGDFWTAGVVMEWPLFSGLGREGRMIQERARYRQKQYLLKNTEQSVYVEVQQALLTLEDADEFVDSQKLNYERAREGFRLVEVGFREGVNTQVEVTDTRAAMTRASGLYFQSLYGHTMSRLNLQRVLGILGPAAGKKQNAVDIVKPADLEGSINTIRTQQKSAISE